MANTKKSWKGKPTINYTFSPDDLTLWVKGDGVTVEGGYEDPHGSNNAFRVTTSNSDYLASNTNLYSPDGLTQYTFSVWIKGTGSIIMYHGASTSNGYSSTTITATDTWTRYTLTGIPNTSLYRIGGMFRSLGTNEVFYIYCPQFEQSAFVTPFVNGTRSNTQAVIDLAKTNIITANNLTYSSDNLFTFDGTDDYISIPSIDFSNEQTIEIWLKPKETGGARRNPYNQAYGGYGTWTHETSGVINYYYGDSGANALPYISHASAFTVVQNEIACVCTTRNATRSVWYKNGVEYNSYTNSFGTLATDNNSILIGKGYAGAYLGDIYSVRLYNRVLSPAEIQQNFNATRGRYGI